MLKAGGGFLVSLYDIRGETGDKQGWRGDGYKVANVIMVIVSYRFPRAIRNVTGPGEGQGCLLGRLGLLLPQETVSPSPSFYEYLVWVYVLYLCMQALA